MPTPFDMMNQRNLATKGDLAKLATAPGYGPLRNPDGTPARAFRDDEMADVNSGKIQLRPGDFTSMPQGGANDPSLSPAGAALTGKGMVPLGGFLPGTAQPIAAGSEGAYAQSATSPMSWQAILNSVPMYTRHEDGVLSSYRDPQALAAAMHFMGQQQATEAANKQSDVNAALGWANVGNEQKKLGLLEKQLDPRFAKGQEALKLAGEFARQNLGTDEAARRLTGFGALADAASQHYPGATPAAPPASPAGTPPANRPAQGQQPPGAGPATPQNPILAAQALQNQKAQQWGPGVQGLFDKLGSTNEPGITPEEFWAGVMRADKSSPGLMQRAGPQIVDQFKGARGDSALSSFINPGFLPGVGAIVRDVFGVDNDADAARVALRRYMGQVRRVGGRPDFNGGPAHPSALMGPTGPGTMPGIPLQHPGQR